MSGSSHHRKTSKPVFMTEQEISDTLREMENDGGLNTKLSSVDCLPEELDTLTFYAKHSNYLKLHPRVNPESYLSNLRTMIKIRG